MAYFAENFNSWNETQARCRYLLGITDQNIRCVPYQGLGHALVDLVYGLKEFWPTRKSLALSTFGSPFLRESVQGLTLSGVNVVALETPRTKDFDEWIGTLPKDLFSVVVVRDHCMTGEILTTDEELAKFNEKRIPHIEIQNGWAWSRSRLPHPFGIQIRVLEADKVIVVIGSRIRFIPHSASLFDWTNFEWERSVLECTVQNREAKETVTGFERQILQMNSGIQTYLSEEVPRLFDRCVLMVDGINGLYFLERLLEHLNGLKMRSPGYESRCETTNLARWQGAFPWTWWGAKPLSEREQRSLVILSTSFLRQQLSPELVNKVYLECQSRTKKQWESTT